MTDTRSRDAIRAHVACKAMLDSRDPQRDFGAVMTTLEHTVATLLILACDDAKRAAGMLNEGLVPGIEQRLARFEAGKRGGGQQ